MGIFSIVICIVAVLLSRGKPIITPAIIGLVINVWSFGVMHNYKNKPQDAPNFWTVSNFLSTLAGILFIILSFIIK